MKLSLTILVLAFFVSVSSDMANAAGGFFSGYTAERGVKAEKALISATREGDLELLESCLSDPDLVFISGRMPREKRVLIVAAESGHEHVVEFLLNKYRINPIYVNSIDRKGQTALMGAATNGHKNIVRLLLYARAQPTAEQLDRLSSQARGIIFHEFNQRCKDEYGDSLVQAVHLPDDLAYLIARMLLGDLVLDKASSGR